MYFYKLHKLHTVLYGSSEHLGEKTTLQKKDKAFIQSMVDKTRNNKGEEIAQSWKDVHSRIYSGLMKTYKDKKRASHGCNLGKPMWVKKHPQ